MTRYKVSDSYGNVLLLVDGLVAAGVGFIVLFMPAAFFTSHGIVADADPDLLSELRAPGALLLGSGVVMLLGVRFSALTRHAFVLAVLVFGSYASARVLSALLDGMPSSAIFAAFGVELLLALLSLHALYKNSGVRVGFSPKEAL